MWWEILPSATIITVLLSLPYYTCTVWNRVAYGCEYRRKLETLFERNMFGRDARLTGAPWILNGLDAIPDETPENETKSI